MIFWIFVILLVVGIAMYVVDDKLCIYSELLGIGGASIAVISGIVVFILTVIIFCRYSTSAGYKASNEEIYKSLQYKMQTEQCRDEFGIMNKEFIDEVQNWNADVAKYKTYQRDFWIGIFYPNIFDDFETIDLSEIRYKESEVSE